MRFILLVALATLGVGASIAVAATTTSTSESCATTTSASHTVGVDGSDVATVGGDTLSVCATATATGSDQTETVTTTVPGPTTTVTTTVGTTTAPPVDQSFVGMTNWARPDPGTPAAATADGWRLVPFTTKAGLDSAISGMQGHDYIYYNGTGALTISNSSSNGYVIASKNPASEVVIDLGTSHSEWNPSAESASYVKFSYTGTGNFYALWLNADSNLTIFGGDISTSTNGAGLLINAPSHDLTVEDAYLHSIAESGVAVRGGTSSGAASQDYNLLVRAEVAGFCLNPVFDPHADKGTGCHAAILHGGGDLRDSTFAIDGHDPIAPGGRSLTNVVWPEGTGGSCIEQGDNSSTENYSNDVLYAGCANLLMKPGFGTNPGSTGVVQTGGNLFNMWGSAKLNGNRVYGWGTNLTGAMLHSDNGSWFPGNPALTYVYGRATNTNQYTGGGNITQVYPLKAPNGTSLGIIYQDVQPAPS